jgi:mRNA-degrading endonuclease RelE of RelBE toxin-antitoxin system
VSRRVTWSRDALKDMRRLGSVTSERVGRAVDRYAETGHGDVKPVLGSEIDEQRLKVGKVRVFFTEDRDEIRIDAVVPRDKAYRTREPMESYGIRELSMAGAS